MTKENEEEENEDEVSYENQTNLFRQIGRKDWDKTLQILQEHPEQAKIWIVTRYHGGALVSGAHDVTVWYRRLPLHHACSAKTVTPQVIEALLEAYPEALLERDETGKIPLIHACRRDTSSMDAVKAVLTEKTAKTHDAEGKCALHWACEYRCTKPKVQLLVDAAPSVVKHVDNYGRLPLHWECSIVSERKEKMSVVSYLVEQYPEAVNLKDSDGRTPLQMIDLANVFEFLSKVQEKLSGGGAAVKD